MITFWHPYSRLRAEPGVLVVARSQSVQRQATHQHLSRQTIAGRARTLAGVAEKFQSKRLSIWYFSSCVANPCTAAIGRLELEPIARQARQELEGEVGRPDAVLEIEEPVVLGHPVPPPRHEGRALGRHEGGELVVLDVVVA